MITLADEIEVAEPPGRPGPAFPPVPRRRRLPGHDRGQPGDARRRGDRGDRHRSRGWRTRTSIWSIRIPSRTSSSSSVTARIIGYARCEWRDLTAGGRTFVSICLLHPDERRQGIGRAMLGWCEARLAAKAAALPDRATVPATMQAFAPGAEAGRGRVARADGLDRGRATATRWSARPWTTSRTCAMPEGLVVRPIGTDDASRRRVWDAAADAFRDHRSEAEWTEEDWLHFLGDQAQDPSLWVVAFDGDEIAGAVLGKIDPAENAHHGRERGIADVVFTRRAWRRRGLARALLAPGARAPA